MLNRLKQIFELNQIVRVVGIIVSVTLIYNTVLTVRKNYALEQKVRDLREKIELLELKNKQVELKIAYLKTDEFLELAAREKFNKKASGERVLVLPRSQDDDKGSSAAKHEFKENKDPLYLRNLKSWLGVLFGDEG